MDAEHTNAGRDDAASLDLHVELIDETAEPPHLDENQVAKLARHVLAASGATGPWEVTVALVSDDRLRALHDQFMGIDTVTDVMTFAADDSSDVRGGDIVISVERAAEQGPENGLNLEAELRFLVVHGLLHLCGWDDQTDDAREEMLDRQRGLLSGFGS